MSRKHAVRKLTYANSVAGFRKERGMTRDVHALDEILRKKNRLRTPVRSAAHAEAQQTHPRGCGRQRA